MIVFGRMEILERLHLFDAMATFSCVDSLASFEILLKVDPSGDGASSEQNVLNGLLASLVSETEGVKTARAFLEENSKVEVCRELLKLWDRSGVFLAALVHMYTIVYFSSYFADVPSLCCSLKLETQNVLSLVAQLRSLRMYKERLRINLQRAEEEVWSS